ncbi:putative U-box domain protein [Aspergillus foveolatus]|uniref:putative U-box domain protein n=1 Tax=Aspergillus foveolatus TaxID=210207 RepID=UPI003CCCC99A
MSDELKKQGDKAYKEGNYTDAENYYSQAITKNPREAAYFANRAITRSKLENWAGAEHDARAAIELYGQKSPFSLKSCNYLAQALLNLQRPQEAYDVAIDAYRASLAVRNTDMPGKKPPSQTENLSKTVLRAKQQIWAAKESARLREMSQTLAMMEQLVEADLNRALGDLQRQLDQGEIGQTGFLESQKELREDAEKNIQNLRDAFRIASNGEIQERIVPDYLIDPITFEIMHDPVIVPSGTSFDRIGILKYVEQSGVDPITRTPMTVNDLRPNYALKAACEDFLTKNGWAVDW